MKGFAVQNLSKEQIFAASEPFGVEARALAGASVIDVRRAPAFEQATVMIPGARWRDPARVDQWACELSAGSPVIVYCVYGHEVSRGTVLHLRAAGIDARFLQGGIDAWQQAGRPVAPKP